MNRVAQLAVLAVIAVAVVAGLIWWLGRGEVPDLAETTSPDAPAPGNSAPPPAAPAQPGEPALSQAPPADQATGSDEAIAVAPTPGAQTAAPPPQVVARPTPEASSEFLAPSFDVVRVEKNGEAVVAGRAEPRSKVTLYDNGAAIASTTTDSNGEWVLVPEQPLAPGNHELGVTARDADGRSAQSSDVVIVFVPRPPAIAAAEPSQPSRQPAEGRSTMRSHVRSDAKPVTPESAPIDSQKNQPSNTTASSPGAPATKAPLVAQPDTGAPEPRPAGIAATPDPAGTADSTEADEEQMTATTPDSGTEGPLVIIAPRDGGSARVLQQPETSEEGIVAGHLALETIDYDREGRASVGGRAAPGNRVRIYLDNRLVGEAQSDRQGRWSTTLDARIKPGLHQLRVDELGPDGEVIARIEAPFSRAEVVADLPHERTVIVQWGNSLWRIARRTYGDGMQYHTIYQANANQIRDPDLIYPGQVFNLPEQN